MSCGGIGIALGIVLGILAVVVILAFMSKLFVPYSQSVLSPRSAFQSSDLILARSYTEAIYFTLQNSSYPSSGEILFAVNRISAMLSQGSTHIDLLTSVIDV